MSTMINKILSENNYYITNESNIDYEKELIGIDIGQHDLFTFSDDIKLYGKMINTYSINDIGIKLVTWCKENPQIDKKDINNWMTKIDRIRKERKYHINMILNQIFDENPNIKVIVMEHNLCLSRELINKGLQQFNIGKLTNDKDLIQKGWRRYTKGMTCMIDESQELIKKICKQHGITLIQTPKGWISTYRCSVKNEPFDKKMWLIQYNNSEKKRCEDDYMFNRSVHNINNIIQKIITKNNKNPNYELAKLIANQEIRLHNSKFDNINDKLKLIHENDIINAKNDKEGYLVVIPDRKIDINLTKYSNICKIRKYECPICGQIHDRDKNASINIKKKGIEILEKNECIFN